MPDWGWQSGKKILSLHNTVFQDIGLGLCSQRHTLLCTVMVSLFAFYVAFCATPQIGRLVELKMRFCIELIPDSTVYAILDWFHVAFRSWSFENENA